MKIGFNVIKSTPLSNRKALKEFLKQISNKEKKIIHSLDYVFCSDEDLLDINQKFLNHDYYTDIITFNLTTGTSEAIVGEIYISIDRVKENAKHFKTTIQKELHRVVFHGILHLCGYNDKTKAQKTIMTQKENHYLKMYLGF